MKSVITYINEKLVLNKNIKKQNNTIYTVIKNDDDLRDYINKKFNEDNIHLNLSYLDFSNYKNQFNGGSISQIVTFNRDIQIKTKVIDVTNWNLTNIISLKKLFCWMENVEDIIGLDTWDVSNIVCFEETFENCQKLTNLSDIEKWNMSSAENIRYMFCDCRSLEYIDLSRWHPAVLTYIENCFQNCYLLKEIKGLNNFKVHDIKWFTCIFKNCKSLTNIDISKWDISSSIISTQNMFDGCVLLQSICTNNLNNWKYNIYHAKDIDYMFYNCHKLKLNIGDWNIKKTTSTTRAFTGVDRKIFIKPYNK